ncbi:unnamed protein product [Pieris brassicae]|uniref:Uncharacterized protein n=1 Tax=Pieris brassicae TaxID=7116 RepID=A0A9P0SGZ1_PIEBR|nr:unnamed protein product [Pieris brassicae]
MYSRPTRGRRPLAQRLCERDDIRQIVEYIHRVRKPTSVPRFLYCITPTCRFDRALFRLCKPRVETTVLP